MTLSTLLERWRQVQGGDALTRTPLLHQSGTLQTGGLSGRLELWQSDRGAFRQDFVLEGGLSDLTVFDGHRAWKRDQGGNVRELAAQELEGSVTQAFLGCFAVLVSQRMAGDVSYLSEESGEGGHVLRVEPAGGRVVTLTLGAESFLPVKQEMRVHDRIQTTTFEDWREVAGIRLPFRARQSSGDPRFDVDITITEAAVLHEVDPSLFERPTTTATTLLRETHELPMDLVNNHIYLAGKISGQGPFHIVLDTGAGGSAIRRAVVERLGLEERGTLEVRGAGEGSADMSLVTGVPLELGTLRLDDLTLIAIDLEALLPVEGRPMDVILGYDLIGRIVLEVDYAAGRVRFHPAKTFSYRGPGSRLALTLENNHPNVRATVAVPGIEPLETTLMVDTGANASVVLSSGFLDRTGLLASIPETLELPPIITGAIGGSGKVLIGRLGSFELGGHRFEDLPVRLSRAASGALGQHQGGAGIIGSELLRRFRVFFDYGRQEMILEPGEHYRQPFEVDASGLQLVAAADDLRARLIHGVLPDSPASRAEVRAGDRLTTVDGEDAGSIALHELRERFKGPGATRQLVLERDGATVEVALRLERLI